MIDVPKAGAPLLESEYKDLARALREVELADEAERAVADVGDASERERVLAGLIARERLPGVFADLLAYGTAVRNVRRAPAPTAPAVDAVTPWLRVAYEDFRAAFPIRAYIRGEVDNPLKISGRPTHYLVAADSRKPGKVLFAEVDDGAFLDGLAQAEPIHVLLRRTRDVPQWLGWLNALAEAGVVTWLLPEPEYGRR